jgi:hypothetical protein
MRHALLGLVIPAILLIGTHPVAARSGSWMGPATGAPSEGNCTGCHSGSALNSPPGSDWIVAPAQYVPNDTVTVFVSVESAGKIRWGFEITALNSSNQPVGQFVVSDGVNTRITTDAGTGRQYMFHTSTGTYINTADSSLGWTFKWVAPGPGAGAITLYMANVAANGSGSSGDKVFTTSKTLTESLVSDVGDDDTRPGSFALHQNYPNPFNPQTVIGYELSQASRVELTIFNALGRQVRNFAEGYQAPGPHSRLWDGRDDQGHTVAAGVYFYRLEVGTKSTTNRMLLLK